MIVFLDIKHNTVFLYKENKVKMISFIDVHKIEHYAAGEKIYYITNLVEVTSSDIISLVDGLNQSENTSSKDSKYYLHNTHSGVLHICSELSFDGKYDFKLFDDNLKKIMTKYPLINKLIKNGKISLVTEYEKILLLKERKEIMSDKQSQKDESLNNLLVERDSDGDFKTRIKDDIPEIDIIAGGGEGPATMSENIANIDNL